MKKDTRRRNCVPRASTEKKSGDFTRKIEPLQGGLVCEMVRCGRSNCKCINGSLHGPYYYHVWMVRGKRFKKYVKKSEKQIVLAAVSAYKQRGAEQRKARERNRELIREIKQNNKRLDFILQLVRKGAIKL
jgi:hypothetical protein